MSNRLCNRLSTLCACACIALALPPANAAPPFFDGFDTPGLKLDLGLWTTEIGPSSFLGRTQLQDWVTPGGIGQFLVSGGQAQLVLDTFNPTGFSLFGTHAKTLATFQPTAGMGYELAARMTLNSLQPGLVYGLFFYGCQAGPCATNHDELDIEIVTNYLQATGSPLRVQLNRYANEPLGAGHGPIVDLPAGFDPLVPHDWRIRWMADRVTYSVDGTLLHSTTSFVPQGSMQANIIAWGPAAEWADGYSAALLPTGSAASNQRFSAMVDFVTVTPMPASPRDFNGDGKSDIFWTNTITGDRDVWFMNGTTLTNSVYINTVPTNWKIVGSGDFDGDGITDLLWHDETGGAVVVWLMNGTTLKNSAFIYTLPTVWQVSGVGDFNADGKPDILWTNTATGERYVWLMNGLGIASSVYLGSVPTNWKIAGVGDFDGDGQTDILWHDDSGGAVVVWLMNRATLKSSSFIYTLPPVWQVSGAGDFNGDGKPDILWTNTATGDRFIWLMNGLGIASSVYIGTVPPEWSMAP
jgi:hypothetical protein